LITQELKNMPSKNKDKNKSINNDNYKKYSFAQLNQINNNLNKMNLENN